MSVSRSSPPGALVISLDFELHWGMRDHADRNSSPFADLAGSRQVVTELAGRFADRGIRATWATVGFLFAATAAELVAHQPSVRPSYRQSGFDPYTEPVGETEAADPEHLAGSLVRQLASAPGQEVASHTFSHYYCLEPGQREREFRADLAAAQSIAGLYGLHLSSLVLPRNQWNPEYAGAVLDSGFTCIRGPQPSWGHEARPSRGHTSMRRVSRLIDTYGGLTPPPTVAWDRIRRPDGLCDVPASAFLRPLVPGRSRLEPLQLRRLMAGMRDAARRGRVFHLWWHPHNFARYPDESYDFLDRLLDEFASLSDREGMVSLAMRDVVTSVETMENGRILGDSQV